MADNKKVLIVEDDNFILDMYKLLFMKKDYEVLTAADGEAGLEMAKGNKVDAILLDIMLPKMNGIEVLRELRKEDATTKDTPVFLLSNLGQEDIIKEAFKIGAQGYMLKANLLPQNVVDQIESYFRANPSHRT